MSWKRDIEFDLDYIKQKLNGTAQALHDYHFGSREGNLMGTLGLINNHAQWIKELEQRLWVLGKKVEALEEREEKRRG